ncbi:glucose 1-dehydrogenase [Microbacterium trichothecenolyticum]|uniref:Glucose 1-dehydrogenase n=1 Tax=Microbacterium ureisolvens TaxID=2781186 RepID=A0ABS7HYD3_9MICO|nr:MULTISPECIES: glucose 1-dehydrogenase [Microbacterium]MBW9110394.1 glucose 1-dehydrogenase [Microbacterium ureisolvens]MBW9120499.1 glucose 1-dehydrogenase [Microbacterium trichothecenolyticum]
MSGRLAGKVALVTGGCGGMGVSHARAIAREGGRVLIADLDELGGAEVAAMLGDAVSYLRLDVTSTLQWAAVVAHIENTFGRLDVLVNNAGILDFAPIDEYEDAAWDRIIAINLTGAFKGIRAVTPLMTAAGSASIVNISSTAGLRGFARVAGYNASKFGLRGLTKSAAMELAPRGIRVNSIHPGNIQTPMIDGFFDSFPHVPMHRAGRPEEISELVVYLASDESSFATGAEFVIDGGETAGLPAE